MSEGEISIKPAQYPSGAFPESGVEYETRQGIKFMIYAMVVAIIDIILNLIYYPIATTMFYEGGLDQGVWALVVALNGVSFLLFLGFIILACISLYQFNRGRFEFDQQHVEDVKWVKIFVISYVILFIFSIVVFPLLFIRMTFEDWYILNSISPAISILLNFFIAISIFLLVRSFAGNFEKDLLYVVSGFLIVIPILRIIYELAFFSTLQGLELFGSIMYITFFSSISLILWCLALFAYFKILKSFDPFGKYTPLESSKFIPRPKPIAKYGFYFYSKPILAFLVVLIIAIALGVASGISYRAQMERVGSSSSNYDNNGDNTASGETNSVEITESGTLTEGEQVNLDFNLDSSTFDLTISFMIISEITMKAIIMKYWVMK